MTSFTDPRVRALTGADTAEEFGNRNPGSGRIDCSDGTVQGDRSFRQDAVMSAQLRGFGTVD
ncbi:hypothetical protein [Rhodococcus sp. MALMAid1271]|uniref:hypothetical protein n=1 Tax=Rhodococcus sp. MALMAid1271 TaxID=3411744 RepID=UPI0030F5EE56